MKSGDLLAVNASENIQMSNRSTVSGFKKIVWRYSLAFAVFCSVCVLSLFLVNGKSLFTQDDGLFSHYTYFLYTGKWIRELFSGYLPMWDMSLGMGADPLISMVNISNPFADPFYWISAVIPLSIDEIAFDIVIILKFYAAGLSFVYFAHHFEPEKVKAVVAGSMVYLFSGVAFVGFRQPNFLNVFILFPLLIVGMDRVWKKKGSVLYVIVLALSVWYSCYFTYVMGLLIIIYCTGRFIYEKEQRTIRRLFGLLGRVISRTLIGIAIGIGPQIPAMINLTGLDRLKTHSSFAVIDISGVSEMILHSFSYYNMWSESLWGFSSVALICLICLFGQKKYGYIKILFVIFSLSFLFPAIGSIFNGFNYSAKRYVFGFILLIAYIVTLMFDELERIGFKSASCVMGISLLLIIIGVLRGDRTVILSFVSSAIISAGILAANKIKTKTRDIFLFGGLLFSCLIVGYSMSYSSMWQQKEFGSANGSLFKDYEVYLASEENMLNGREVRYDTLLNAYTDVPVNSSMIMDLNGYDAYHSNYNNYLDHYYDHMAIVSNAMGFQQTGLRGRVLLEIQNGTGYIVRQNSDERGIRAPHLYEHISETDTYDLYELSNGASLVYFYDDAISYEQYDNVLPVDREELTMRYCAIDEQIPNAEVNSAHSVIDTVISDENGIVYEGEKVSVDEAGFIELQIPKDTYYDLCIYVDDLNHDQAAGDPYYYQFAVVLMNGDKAVAADYYTGIDNNFSYYHGKDTLLFDLGCVNSEADSIRLYFNTPGEYSLGDVVVCERNEAQLDAVTKAFYDHAGIDDISYEITGNKIIADITADKDKYLYFAIPYSEGWSATIDGETADILRANEAFMAVHVPSGAHNVELRYKTPYLFEGIIISMIIGAAYIAFEVWQIKRENQ